MPSLQYFVIIFMFRAMKVLRQESERIEEIGAGETSGDTSPGKLIYRYYLVVTFSTRKDGKEMIKMKTELVSVTYCENGIVSKNGVTQLLAIINNQRTMLASGLLANISYDEDWNPMFDVFPPAKNMRKMTYDCALEQEANEFLAERTCLQLRLITIGNQEGPDRGFLFDSVAPIQSALYGMFDLMEVGGWPASTTNKSVKYTPYAEDPASFTVNLLRSDASKIGCASRSCGEISHVIYHFCMTNQKNIQDGEEIYEIGEKPEFDPLISDVDPIVTSQAEFPGSDSESSTLCGWKEINDTLRMHMLDTHNFRRTTLALGQITDNTGITLPAATNMNYLRWNCTLEKEAHDFLRNCPKEGYQRPDDDSPAQNFYRGAITANEPTYRDMNKKTVTEWWKPVRKVAGPGTRVIFQSEHNNSTIRSFTLMGWASTKEIGCSMAKCGNDWVEACRYYPPGNNIDEQMYRKGKACSECSNFGVGPCDPKLALCVSKE